MLKVLIAGVNGQLGKSFFIGLLNPIKLSGYFFGKKTKILCFELR